MYDWLASEYCGYGFEGAAYSLRERALIGTKRHILSDSLNHALCVGRKETCPFNLVHFALSVGWVCGVELLVKLLKPLGLKGLVPNDVGRREVGDGRYGGIVGSRHVRLAVKSFQQAIEYESSSQTYYISQREEFFVGSANQSQVMIVGSTVKPM